MKVLHFFKTYFPDTTGGIEQVIFQLCEGGRQFGVESKVLTLGSASYPPLMVGGHQVHRARRDMFIASTGFSFQAFCLFKEMAAQADVVHFHFPWPMMDLVHFCTRHGRPTVLSYHSDIVRQRKLLMLYRPLMRLFLKSVDRIVVSSPNYLASSVELKRYLSKVVVIPFGLSFSNYPYVQPERMDAWRRRVGDNFFLFVGVLRYYKGLNVLLEAISGLDYPLVIIGSGPEESALKTQAERLNLRNVIFLGRLDDEDKVCLLKLSHALIFPSNLRSEAFGISLLEAAMYGKPMISCEIGTGTSYVNLHGVTGLVVPPASMSALRNAIQYLWENRDEAQKFGNNARQRYEQLFTADRMCEKMAHVYRDVVALN